ncbi:TIGR03790 family protein [Candidatus Pacearchaeota archaeon]|nr:TIGR03790 family protein [Candidatus Pacearchaeota archaeon]
MKKRGLSTVVSSIVIVLLVVTAAGVLWNPIKTLLENSESSISTQDFLVNLVIKSVMVDSSENSASIKIRNNVGTENINITSIDFLFEDEFHSELIRVQIPEGFSEIGEKTFTLNLSRDQINVDLLKKISIIPIYTESNGKEISSSIPSSEYQIKNITLIKKPKEKPKELNYSDVLLVTNLNSQESIEISNYYIKTRGPMPQLNLSITTDEKISYTVFNTTIRQPIEKYLIQNNLTNSTNYIVLTKGIPLRMDSSGACKAVDSLLTIILSKYSYFIEGQLWGGCGASSFWGRTNPVYLKTGPVNKSHYDIYMVARLDGYTAQDVINAMGPSSLYPTEGDFLLDKQISNNATPFYVSFDAHLELANSILKGKGFSTILDNTTTFQINLNNLMGYYSFGSNDANAPTANSSQWNLTFNHGSIGDTAVSTSGRTFNPVASYYSPDVGIDQSLVSDLVTGGMSFVKGYVHEPGSNSISHPEIVIDRYASGYTAGESMYMGSYYINWKGVYIGDPKIRIYHP